MVYLSPTDVADPTVVLDQRYGDAMPAPRAHVCHPLEGAVLLFPGDRLHCVCPAAPPAPARPQRHGRRPSPLKRSAALPRRVTLMIGFWTRDVASVIKRAPYTACSAAPRPSRACTWPALLDLDEPTRRQLALSHDARQDLRRQHATSTAAGGRAAKDHCAERGGAKGRAAAAAEEEGREVWRSSGSPVAASRQPVCHRVAEVRPAWEAIEPRIDQEAAVAAGVAPPLDAWVTSGRAPLRVPELRNNHFFVQDMDEFVFEEDGCPADE